MEPVAILMIVSAAALGLLVGSFANVCIYRLPRQCMSIVAPRSMCLECKSTIRWYDNIPVLSYVLLKGKCRKCAAKISARYPLVEAITGALFFLIAWKFLVTEDGHFTPKFGIFAVYAIFASALVIASFIDVSLSILPDEITMGGLFLAPFVSILVPELHHGAADYVSNPVAARFAFSVFGILVGGGSLFLVGALGRLWFREEAMGWGDIKFLAMIGGILGYSSTLVALFVAVLTGAIGGVFVLIVRKREGPGRARIPFGLFLSVGAVSQLLFSEWTTRFFFETYPSIIRSLGADAQ
ncbi:MAG: prepilin peptidase [Planctomycetes bacterium]|nr:prepilin peptidase [Planctomycetota bacterium]